MVFIQSINKHLFKCVPMMLVTEQDQNPVFPAPYAICHDGPGPGSNAREMGKQRSWPSRVLKQDQAQFRENTVADLWICRLMEDFLKSGGTVLRESPLNRQVGDKLSICSTGEVESHG